MFLSVVSGTYNRLTYLQKMVASVRRSIGVGIPYEIVLVDGGSTDGTITWCKTQHDIVLIEQVELLGAVKAFNAGAYAARGKYVILANDDIEFIDESILCAISFMEDNWYVGIGCFYQDRRGWNWHVEQMSAVTEDGKSTTTYYGQVCIVRKWIGDKVGWWGDYLHTYGGDNELSCNVVELGYNILPVPCAKIHDFTPKDDLRDKNNNRAKVDGQHPDTYLWLKKWTRNGKLGPIVRTNKNISSAAKQKDVRILYLPIYEPGHQLQKSTKRGLRNALAKTGLVVEYDYLNNDLNHVLDIACAFDPHLIVTQIHGGDAKFHSLIAGFRDILDPVVKIVNWNGDYHPETLYTDAYLMLMQRFDLVGVVTTSVADIFDAKGIDWFYWQIGYEEVSDNLRAGSKHDVLFLGNGYSKDRIQLAATLKGMKDIDVGLYGSWPNYIRANGSTLYDFEAGARLYKACKIAIGDSQWQSATGFVSNRLFQAMAAGAFLLHQHFDGMEELLGLRDGENIAVWNTVSDLEDKIRYYLTHEDERKRIADVGTRFIREHHSFDKRVDELFAELNKLYVRINA